MRAFAIICVLAAAARADHHVERIKVPAGWRPERDKSGALAAKLRDLPQFGVARPNHLLVDIYHAPGSAVVLSVVAVGVTPPADRATAARVAVDDFHATTQRAALAGRDIVEEGWQEQVDSVANRIEATLAWRDRDTKTSSKARMLIGADNEHMVAVTAECFASAEARPQLVADCEAALATLDFGPYPRQRQPVALAPPGARPPPSATAATTATLTDGKRTPLPPLTISQDPRAIDRRPVYVGFGLVVLAAVFYWNRRRRARLEDKTHER